ncbi:uncharacterized protein LOC125473888 [Pyrus x bretschneideri]|uniref:uncharacterized protein LOC125473888 n=1 Tax=Pyrus x bretschneideri TaxID=225117 RepID=UPI00202EFE19|nr:uncharacterized protein LOC125473888 [Pyrus x bretschneideri]
MRTLWTHPLVDASLRVTVRTEISYNLLEKCRHSMSWDYLRLDFIPYLLLSLFYCFGKKKNLDKESSTPCLPKVAKGQAQRLPGVNSPPAVSGHKGYADLTSYPTSSDFSLAFNQATLLEHSNKRLYMGLKGATYQHFHRHLEATLVQNELKHGGTLSRRQRVNRDREESHVELMHDYFSNPPLYLPRFFRARFYMRRELFDMIMERVVNFDNYFTQRCDAPGKLGFSPYVKITAAF